MHPLLVRTMTTIKLTNGKNHVIVPAGTQGRVLIPHLRDYQGQVHAYVDFADKGRWLVSQRYIWLLGRTRPNH